MAKATVIAIAFLMASFTLIVMPGYAQLGEDTAHGGTPQIPVTGGPLPAGVVPSVSVDSIAYLSFRPNPVGVGQTFLVNIWLQPPIHVERGHTGYTTTITKPDGTKDSIGPLISYQGDTTAWFEYVADQVGTWKLKFDFAGDYYPAGYYLNGIVYETAGTGRVYLDSAYYKPASTAELELTVQTDQIMSWPPSPLPTDYWTRPVSPENREWWTILGDYPWTGYMKNPPQETNHYASNYKFTPYVQAPSTAHIVWKRQYALSGIMGGDAGQKLFGSGEGSYAGTPNIIFEGRCYQTVTKPMLTLVNGTYRTLPVSVWQCYDLRNGQVNWELTDVTAPTGITYVTESGQIVPGATESQVGLGASLVAISGGRLIKYHPYTGAVTLNVSISPLTTGTLYKDPYALSVQSLGGNQYRLINWTTAGTGTDFTARIMNNITYPFSSVGTSDYEVAIAVSTAGITSPGTGVAIGARIMAASLTTGQLLWNVTTDLSSGHQTIFSGSTACADHGKFTVRMNDGSWYCWDLYSGKRLWTSESEDWPWGTFGAYNVASAYGLFYDLTYAGVYAIDWNTGAITWHYNPTYPGYEAPYSSYPFFANPIVADGKLYVTNAEHSPTAPLMRGWKLHCINATTGEGIWNITGGGTVGAVADGYITFDSRYDGHMYVFGKGKSATTVSTLQTVIAKGQTVMLTGTVLDQSPAQPDTPCVSKDSMTTQMEYLHMQHPIDGIDHNVQMTGVPVTLTAIDSNGNVVDIGAATSSAYYGTFEKAWTPSAEGTYRVIASFAGDESYGSSAASTAVSVEPAAETPQPPENPVIPDYTWTIIGGVIAVIIAVAIVGVLMLRKR